MSAPCNRQAPAYNAARSLETSRIAEPRTRQTCGFFVPGHQVSCACYPVSMPDGVPGNTQYLEPSIRGFEPPSGAHSLGLPTRLEETDMADDFDPTAPLAPRSNTLLDVNRERLIDALYSMQVDLALLALFLKSNPAPAIPHGVLEYLGAMQWTARQFMPSMNRH